MEMLRALAVLTACLLLLGSNRARADQIAQNVKETHARSSKVRLAATLSLSKSRDARAVLAVSAALENDDDPTIRRVAALALEKMIDRSTAEDARSLAFDALEKAKNTDGNAKVKSTAAATLKALASLRTSSHGSSSTSSKPTVFVNIDPATDQSRKAPKDAADRVVKIVRKSIESKTGYATTWPGGGLPTSKELTTSKSQAYIVASTVKKIEVTKGARQATIACTVAIRVAPWGGKDGGEKWEANRAASASGSAKAMTGNSERAISSGMRDCLEAVAEDVSTRQVVPFIKRLATNP
jgi:CO dehydrogenase/acetyl-CoA synthase gamma subunit (corrinoid Fe-S protein)